MAGASGSRVALRYVREATRGTLPAGVTTPVASIAADSTGTGTSKFTRATGSFVTDGFTAGQWILAAGFAATANNTYWRIQSVSALELVVEDTDDVIVTEAAEVGQTVRIAMSDLRATTRNINLEKTILESAEVRQDRQKSDVRHGFNRVAGSIGFEISSMSYDDLLEVIFGRPWATVAVTGGVNIGAAASGFFTRSGGSWITDGFRPGDVVRVAGFGGGDIGNNGDWTVTAVTASNLTVYDPDGAMTTVAAGAGPTLTYPGKRLDVGTVLATMAIERAFLNVAKYQLFTGISLDQMAFSIQPEAIAGGTINPLGMRAIPMASSPISSAASRSAPTTSPFAAFDGRMFEGGDEVLVATGVDFTFANNNALVPVIGSRYSPDVFQGLVDLTGTLTAFFDDETLYNKFVNEDESSLYIKLEDPDDPTEFLQIVIPRVKYTGAAIEPPPTGPTPINMPFRGLVKELSAPGGTTIFSCITLQRSNAA